jgi:hypothetical protein
MKRIVGLMILGVASACACAKLPPASDDAKAKAAEAAAKTAHGNKVADFQLCKSMDRVAAGYLAEAKKSGKAVNPVATPPCADPGPFAYKPPEAAGAPPAPGAAASPSSPKSPAPAPAPAKKS